LTDMISIKYRIQVGSN